VDVEADGRRVPLERESDGYWSGVVEGAGAGTRYKYRLDDEWSYPDPASRFQPDGPHEASEVIDPEAFEWGDDGWKGVGDKGQVIYELHVGTFTAEGTWESAGRKLEWLRETGVTLVEVMPVSEFPGQFGWGYDGVHPYAPTRLYGRPDDFRRFADRAHTLGIGVILDVVYNHLGPDGNYLGQFSAHYFTDRYQTDWGAAINFDSEKCKAVREFFIANAAYWIREFHLDGLRFDATQNIYDESRDHILAAMVREARRAAPGRGLYFVAENEPQETKLVKDYGITALWNDDYHHSAVVALTGHADAYYTDYKGTPQEFISAAKYGYLYQGQRYKWQKKRRGTPSFGMPAQSFVSFTENHDQVANSARGLRPSRVSDPGTYRAMTALTLLGPATPMLFQGQEYGATTPFFYFADHSADLARLVQTGRTEFMAQFKSLAHGMSGCLPPPGDRRTFERSRLDWAEAERNQEAVAMHRDLLRLRREDGVLGDNAVWVDGAVLSDSAFVLRFFGKGGDDRLLIVNLGRDVVLDRAPEPLLGPPEGKAWTTLWSSEDPRYGGCGAPPVETEEGWELMGRSAVVFSPVETSKEMDE
jgi:maltooligosyltrehalose trehalohydrolase